ncbi:MAG: hypothetical protein P8101_17535 [Candidatus Thiodiazotropha sp.]|jgi:DNA-binding Xre family transcriptional regulator
MTPDELLNQLLHQAEAQDLKEGELAVRAGLTPQGLSKAKARGDLRVSTLEALGRQLDLELSWRPIQPEHDATRRVRSGTLFRFDDKDKGSA